MPQLRGFSRIDAPGPAPLPVVGPVGNVLRFFGDPVGHLLALHREFGDVAAVARDSPALVCAFGAERNRYVLTNPALFQNDSGVPLRAPPGTALERFNLTLPFANGEAHRRRRRLMMPAFARSSVEGYAPDIVQVTDAVLGRWREGDRVDMAALLRTLTAAITLRCIFGLDALDEREELGRLETSLLETLGSPWTMALQWGVPGLPYHRVLQTSARVEARLRRLIAEKRHLGHGKDVLALLVAAKDEDGSTLSDDELVGECNGLFVAGYDTSAQTLAWTLLLLSQHPEVYASVAAEVRSVLGDGPPTPERVPHLVQVDHVLKESMRLLPASAMLFVRVCAQEAKLGPLTLPKHANVVLSPLVTHRDATVFPEPRRFLPERWSTAAPSAYEYLPFGAGSRMCLGAAFATLALRLVLPRLLQRFHPALVEGARVDRAVRGIALAPKNGMPMRLLPPTEVSTRVPLRGDVTELVDWS